MDGVFDLLSGFGHFDLTELMLLFGGDAYFASLEYVKWVEWVE